VSKGKSSTGATPYATPTSTPEPQSPEVQAGRFLAQVTNQSIEGVSLPTVPPVSVTTVDGVPVVVSTPKIGGANDAGVAQIVPDEDLRLFGEEPPSFPVCEFPACKGEGRNQIISGAGRPLSINRKGELVFGDPPPVDEYGMTAAERNRALAGIVGPSGAVGRILPKSHIDVCEVHRSLPHAPKKPKTEHREVFTSYPKASAAAHKIALRTRTEPKVTARKTPDGDSFEVVWFA
jgi:hypothetical protein